MKDIEEGILRQVEGEAKALSALPAELGKEPKAGKKPEGFFDLGAELEKMEPMELQGVPEIETLDKLFGFEEIFRELKETSGPSNVDPNFNYNMGVACREMGFFEDAVEQFSLAVAAGQNAFEAANLLGLLYKEKEMFEEARQAFEKALRMKGISPEKILKIKYELGLLYKEMGRPEEAIQFLKEISAAPQSRVGMDEGGKIDRTVANRANNPKK
jgi:tetratricopeptide (TPR) repeat protein